MKRLPVAPLTIEDHDIWCRVWDGPLHARRPAFRKIAKTGDRRDAELMLGIERARRYEREHPEDFAQYSGMGFVNTLVSVALEDGPIGFQGLGITYFA
jgi:hypothetical protein